ncbi:MAG: type II secretion system protein [Acidobacteria bacterium]|nr:type II secretion system protein [Acidobacteriota bacterium]
MSEKRNANPAGIVSLKEWDCVRPAARRNVKGYSLLELVVVAAIILTLMAMAVPNYLNARASARSASAAGSMQTLNTACIAFQSIYGSFPTKLSELGPPPKGSLPSSQAANFVDEQLARGTRGGYKFSYTPGLADASGNIISFTITAEPTMGQVGGENALCSSSSVPNAKACGSDADPTIGVWGTKKK